MFAETGDIAMCISSSGSSKNILNAAEEAQKSGCSVITFSGFKTDNPLKKLGHINFYVPAYSYGFVEVLHNLIIHCILDAKMYCKDTIDIFNKNTPM
jgi:D-sedoheptulose 7-phosphate isomerase